MKLLWEGFCKRNLHNATNKILANPHVFGIVILARIILRTKILFNEMFKQIFPSCYFIPEMTAATLFGS